ncbi:CBS domain-containing protein [Pseudonocardia sp. ICBG1293]|uniref:CBS domain-containing protein n=1 Tax=Pseudonocardia sp. ICBG1293 TaxID=2844382 RepID=UPI001CC9D7AD|nr:CBS domain-containing protein [Pseudonocardia sp. ICBG1293]
MSTAPSTAPDGVRVATAMHTFPKTCGPATTVAQAWAAFERPKVHSLLVLDGGRLLAVVDRADLAGAGPDEPAAAVGTLHGRVARAGDDLAATWATMADAGRRRVAVVDDDGGLLGLLCLKRHGRGFCSDAGIQARIDERAATRDRP